MVFQIRENDGAVGPFSSGTLVGTDGESQHLTFQDFSVETEST